MMLEPVRRKRHVQMLSIAVQVLNTRISSTVVAAGSSQSPETEQADHAGKKRQDAAAIERLKDLQRAWIKKVLHS